MKEQLASHGGGGGSSAMAPPPPDREDPVISTSQQHKNQDFELAAKDKEVWLVLYIKYKLYTLKSGLPKHTLNTHSTSWYNDKCNNNDNTSYYDMY